MMLVNLKLNLSSYHSFQPFFNEKNRHSVGLFCTQSCTNQRTDNQNSERYDHR